MCVCACGYKVLDFFFLVDCFAVFGAGFDQGLVGF